MAPVQVFFGPVEAAPPISVTYNQIVVLAPPASGAGAPNLNQTVAVRVHEVNSGVDSNTTVTYRFTPPVQIISFDGFNIQPVSGPFSPVTIFGQGFEAPVKVSLAGFIATVMSVSATEITVLPGGALPTGCADLTGPMTVTNINTGDSASGQTFTYAVKTASPVICLGQRVRARRQRLGHDHGGELHGNHDRARSPARRASFSVVNSGLIARDRLGHPASGLPHGHACGHARLGRRRDRHQCVRMLRLGDGALALPCQ